jgi:hypothetical protein
LNKRLLRNRQCLPKFASNGRHEGIVIEIVGQEIVFDNIHHEGISREAWMRNLHCLAMDLGGAFEVTEVEF